MLASDSCTSNLHLQQGCYTEVGVRVVVDVGFLGITNYCLCRVWCRGLTTGLLCVSPLF